MIQAENLAFSYTGSPPFVLDGIRFTVGGGEYVSVLGDNGCGKSTLIKLVLRLLKPTRGSIAVKAKRIGYVPQRSDAAGSGFPITVYEMLDSYRRLLKLRDTRVLEESLSRVGLASHSAALMGTLSGGQSQKALIARALMGNPDLLILDEPSAGVDQESQREIYRLIRTLNAKEGITVISVEHNLEAAVTNSTLIYHLSGGSGHMCTPRQYVSEYLEPKGDEDHA